MGIADGKRALVIGLANDKSLAWPIVQNLKAQGAEIALTYQGEVLERRVRPLAEQVGATVLGELDVGDDARSTPPLAKYASYGVAWTCWSTPSPLPSARTCATVS